MSDSLTRVHPPRVEAADLIKDLRTAWDSPSAEASSFVSFRDAFPLARSKHHQAVPEGTENPFWEIISWMPAAPPSFGGRMPEPQIAPLYFPDELMKSLTEAGALRSRLAAQYTWSIISPGDVAWMVKHLAGRGVVEVGAGTGYWAWQLEQAEVDVAAYDPVPPGPENEWCFGGPYTTVLEEGAEAAAAHPDRALLMAWPPYGGAHARHALSVYKGDLLFYAGEPPEGATADDAFYDLLNEEWEEIDHSRQHVTWWGIHCYLSAYRRRESGTAC